MRSSRKRRGSSTTVAAAVVLAACLGQGAGSSPGYPGAVGGAPSLPQRPGQPVSDALRLMPDNDRYVRIHVVDVDECCSRHEIGPDGQRCCLLFKAFGSAAPLLHPRSFVATWPTRECSLCEDLKTDKPFVAGCACGVSLCDVVGVPIRV